MNSQFDLNIASVPKELILICELLNENKMISGEKFEHIDWSLFLKLSIHHRVYPLLYYKLKDKECVPQNVINRLRTEYKKNTFKMLFLSGEMEQISRQFGEENIKMIHLKGPILAAELYGDLSLRTSSDLDVLVPLSELNKVDRMLLESGYVKEELVSVLNDWKWRHHHIGYVHPKKQIKLEVHWRLNPGPAKEPSFSELWERKRKSSMTNFPVYFLSQEDLLLFLISHGARHGWSRLRWLVDIHQMMKQEFDWKKTKKHLKKFQFLTITEQALILCSQLFKTPINTGLQQKINNRSWKLAQSTIFYYEQLINLHREPLPADVAKYHKNYLFSIKSLQHKFLFILSFLYPYPMDIKVLRLPKFLHFLYFPLRPFIWFFRKTISRTIGEN
ncbi:nucleotidyltransferase domain-containing protein [Metabacillus arenae]|uniref:Nucleotidyltransferase family protein n=1 Tax=Metabacillus arenae TaxID=2771434 RepID=A0A926NDH5_9BACI|nr:nucleotidyltransferase family protein [Metabacillus arenae]MBD1378840.1 nucleotidyltransferase family protein [Metabacillus arenae]